MKGTAEMEKSRILISSGEKTLVLAERLRDTLRTDFSEASLWCDDGRSQTSIAMLEMLEDSAEQFDFAVVILAEDDVTVRGSGDALTRDTNAFEAGLVIATIGRDRCFLVNSVELSHLPSYLGGITSIPFEEPADLTDANECTKAIASIAEVLKDRIKQKGTAPYQVRVPTLSVAQLWQRE
jgi:predicted nucleotide-binding protein